MNKIKLPDKEKLKETLKKAGNVFLSPTIMLCFLLIVSVVLTKINAGDVWASKDRLVPIYSVARDDKCISLTIDAAWGNEYTNQIIEILDKYNVRITFFTVNFWAETYPDDIKSLMLHGHEIGNHSATHPDMAKLSK